MNTCSTCKHWESDYDFPWGYCQLTWTDLTPEDPKNAWEAKFPESKAHCAMLEFTEPYCTEQRALLLTHGLEFGCTQWEQADEHSMKWLEGKLSALKEKS